MNKLTKAGIATAAGIALLMGGAGTLAYWNDSANLTGGAITAGTLKITSVGTGVWSSDKTGTVADIASYRIVPGEKLTYTTTVNISVVGNALTTVQASLGSAAITAATATGAQQTANNALAAALGSSAVLTVTGTGVTGTGPYTIPSSTSSLTVSATLSFPNGAAGAENGAKTGQVNLSGFALTLSQL